MRRTIPFILAGAVIIVAGVSAFMMTRPEPQWTTSSPAALSEFNQGLDAEMKFYQHDAAAHFRKAVELDPNFLAARLRLFMASDMKKDEVEPLRRIISHADLGRLTDRERFLAGMFLAATGNDRNKAEAILDAYLKSHPHDPFALNFRCEQHWGRQAWPAAEKCYQTLIRTDPNWVLAQNRLGYIAMAQGRFGDAERAFETYRYIAPDQSNPHDSLGELLTLLGRYDEAEKELKEAVRIRPDFCAGWQHRISLYLLAGRIDDAEKTLDEFRQIGSCSPAVASFDCSVAGWKEAGRGDWKGVADVLDRGQCVGMKGDGLALRHLAAIELGDFDTAEKLEAMLRKQIESMPRAGRDTYAGLEQLVGSRLVAQHRYDEAIRTLREADSNLSYQGDQQWLVKLYVRMRLAQALEASGDVAGAKKLRAEIAAVNPKFEQRFQPLR
ncbi:MAG: tetratricopeptide repeat protein [Thermoanaerobaculia bacterium]